jgi:SPP1 family predicted phage head-tail adaptor
MFTTIMGGIGRVHPADGFDPLCFQQIAADLSHRVVIRYLAGVTPKHRVVHGSRTFDILMARNIEERGRFIELLCRERV